MQPPCPLGARGGPVDSRSPEIGQPVTSYSSPPHPRSPSSSLGLRHTGPGPPVCFHPERRTALATPHNPHTPCPALPAPDSVALQGKPGRKGQLCSCTHQCPARVRLRTGRGAVWHGSPEEGASLSWGHRAPHGFGPSGSLGKHPLPAPFPLQGHAI